MSAFRNRVRDGSNRKEPGSLITSTTVEGEESKEDVKVITIQNPDGSVTTTTTTVKVTRSFPTGKEPPVESILKKSTKNGNTVTIDGAGSVRRGPKPIISTATIQIGVDDNSAGAGIPTEGKKLFGAATGKNTKFKEIIKEGGASSGKRLPDNVQDYDRIRAELRGTGKLFEDPEFPAADSSIYYSDSGKVNLIWKRPGELVDAPRFFVGGASRFDVNQGELGNCWFLAAVAALTMNDSLFFQVVPKDNSFVEDYCGVFHFRFWQYGRWIDVVIDDRLPCNAQGRQVYMHSTEKTEFWSALLEKAYAKLAGSYEALIGGQASEALQDFSGGLVEMIDLKETKLDIFSVMEKAYKRQSFMSCSLKAHPNVKEAQLRVGLVRGHAYSVTAVHRVDVVTPNKTGKVPLCRIRNPWGNEFEWKGSWSDGSREWQFVPEAIKREIGLSFEDDGEFWMSLKDFQEFYDNLEIVNMSPDSMLPGMKLDGKTWNTSYYEGSWVTGCTAGGCTNFISRDPKTYGCNPQYIVEFDEADADGDPNKSTVLVALMQKNRRSKRKEGIGALSIGFALYEVKESLEKLPNPLDLNYFTYHRRFSDSGMFLNIREVSGRFELLPGVPYCIIPTTFSPNEEGEFLIRVFSEAKNRMKENDGNIGLDIGAVATGEDAQVDGEHTEAIKQLFRKIAGEDEEIGWVKLKGLLDSYLKKVLEFRFDGFSREVCRSMVAMEDLDRTGKLGLDEFAELWTNILRWKNVFKTFDEDASGNLNSFELRKALNSAGYQVNNQVLKALVLRYGDEEGNISFEDFIMCAVKLKAMIDTFKDKDETGKNEANFTLAEWVELTVYA